ncbi:MAG: DUF2231 domain-containing protein [Thiolinea sp.]
MIAMEHIHPMVVHFPIVLIILLAGFDLFFALRGDSVAGRTTAGNLSTLLAVLAAAFSLAAVMFGDMALEHAEEGGFSSEIAEIHEHLGMIAALVLSAWAVIRGFLWFRNNQLSGGMNMLVSLGSVAIAVLVLATAYFGGQLVYDLGVNVTKVAMGG